MTYFLEHLNSSFEKEAFLPFVSGPSVAGITCLILQMLVATLKQTPPPRHPHAFSLAQIFFFLPLLVHGECFLVIEAAGCVLVGEL